MRYDAEGLLHAWINTQTTLVAPAAPMPKGAHLKRLRSPYKGAYAVLTVVGGAAALSPEAPAHRARVSARIYGVSKEGAAAAAVAYANTLERLRGVPTPMSPAVCLFAADITGPLYAPDGGEEAYLVDADIYLK